MDHIRLRIPEEGDGDAGRAVPMSTGVRAFIGEKKARYVQASPLVRSLGTTADHPDGVTCPISGEVEPTDVNQSSGTRQRQRSQIKRSRSLQNFADLLECTIHELRIMLQFS